jgi:hypothetical protein
MIDGVNDEVTDWLDSVQNVLLMEGSRIVEAYMRRLGEMQHEAAAEARTEATEARARLRAEAAQSRMRLQPVMADHWWAGASMEKVAEQYRIAKAWEGIDPSFIPYVERIEAQAKAMHDQDPHQILDHIAPRTEAQLAKEVGGPMTVDEARAAAVTTPVWYGVHEKLTGDLAPLIREREEKRLVADMVLLRDTGRLDNESGRMEWARYTDHPAATMVQDENENLAEFRERRGKLLQEHWDHTVEDRVALGRHNESMAGVARPMSVSEAREFMNEFAPEWFKDGHKEIRIAQVSEHSGENHQYTVSMDDQMRYAMEHLRDTGTLEHSYARSMRDTLALNPDIDLSAGAKPITAEDRVRYGGSQVSRPMSLQEAERLANYYAPQWYTSPVMGALAPDSILSPSQRAGQADALISDMTRLRDHGVLDTDHAMRVWAAQQPAAVDPQWGQALPVQSIWADTVDAREGPQIIPEDVRAATGAGVPGWKAPGLRQDGEGSQVLPDPTQGPVERPAPRQEAERGKGEDQEPKGPKWDSAEARTARARQLREAGFTPEQVRAQMLADWSCATPPGTPNPSRGPSPAKGRENTGPANGRTKSNTLHR